MEQGLKLIIGAEDQATPVFVKTTEGAKKTAEAFAKIPPSANAASTASNSVAQSLGKIAPAAQNTTKAVATASNALNATSKSSSTATQSLVNLSRVAQDAPYGFIGIANNLNPLLEGFQRLRAETGSNRLALKALGSSLLGAGGVGLAIGVVSSLLVVFGDKLFKSKSAVNEQAEAVKKASDALRDYEESLSDFDSINLKGSQDAQAELIKLAGAYKASQDSANISLADRKKIVDQLQEQYPAYFANIKDEVFLAGGAKAAYDRLVSSILATSRARAAADRGVEIAKDRLTVEQQVNDNLAKQNALRADLLAKQNKEKNFRPTVDEFGNQVIDTGPAAQAQNKLNEAIAEGVKLKTQLYELDRRAARVAVQQGDLIAQQPLDVSTLNKNFNDAQKATDAANDKRLSALKAAFEKEKKLYEERQLEIAQFLNAPLQTTDFQQELSDQLARDLIQVKPSDKLTELRMPVKFDFDFSGLGKALPAAIEGADLVGQINDIFKEAFQGVFTGLGEGIATLIQGGDIGDALGGVVKYIGSLITQIGQALIEYGIVQEGLQKILAGGITIPGVAAIAAGVAAVAIGTLIQSSKPKPFAEGGIVYGPTNALIGEYAGASNDPEIVSPLSKLKNLLGDRGGTNINIGGELRVKGYDLVYAFNKNTARQGRNG